MTSIIAWTGVDSRGPASVYIASDSRISWSAAQAWDQGRKTFHSLSAPWIFGYAGDVLFPSLAIPVVVDHLAAGAVSPDPRSAFGPIGSLIRKLWLDYPQQQRRDLSIIMAARTAERMSARFHVGVMTYRADRRDWSTRTEPMPAKSSSLVISGSGARQIRSAEQLWQASRHADTSRAVFGAFCESLREGRDPHTGGAPQLVGLRRIGNGENMGVVYEGHRYLSGSRVSRASAASASSTWFNELFERCDGVSLGKLAGAQRHESR